MLPRQIRPDRSPCGMKYYPNTALFDQIFKYGGSCTYPFTDQGQIWYATLDHGVLFHIKFHLNWCILLYITIYNHTNLNNFIIFRGSCTNPPLPIRTKFGTQEYTYGLCLCIKFHPDQFIVSSPRGKKSQILLDFQLQHSVLAPPIGTETKLNAHAQQQTFPFQRCQNHFHTETP